VPQQRITADEYWRLVEAGIVDKVELIDGVVVMGAYALHFSPEQAAAAARIGIRVQTCLDVVLEDPDLRAEAAARLASQQTEAPTTRTAEDADAWAVLAPLLSDAQARERLGISAQQLDAMTAQGRLLVLVERSGRRRYPGWQFGADQRPLAALVAAHRVLVEQGGMSPWSAASWCVQEHPELDGLSPSAWAHTGRDPERLGSWRPAMRPAPHGEQDDAARARSR
jgi:hypothetical protein